MPNTTIVDPSVARTVGCLTVIVVFVAGLLAGLLLS